MGKNMISYKEALKILEKSAKEFPIIEVAVSDALGMVLAENLNSKINIPSFNNSAMDGFALCSSDTKKPGKLPIINVIEAGDATNIKRQQNCAWEIMTGAVMPPKCDTVLMVEKAQIVEENGQRYLVIDEKIEPQNVRYIGEDFNIGDPIIKSGEAIKPAHIMALCAAGYQQIKVRQTSKIALIATGKEVTDNYQASLKYGQIYNSNSPYLLAYLREKNFVANYYGIISDQEEEFHKVIDQAIKDGAKIIISTGAVSMGSKDFIKQALIDRGMEILFHKVAIKPGKPILFASSNDLHFFGLPGNPISAAVGMQFFILPFLEYSLRAIAKKPILAILKNSIKLKSGLRHFLKARYSFEGGKLLAEILQGQESFKTKPLLQSNCLAATDEERAGAKEGELVELFFN